MKYADRISLEQRKTQTSESIVKAQNYFAKKRIYFDDPMQVRLESLFFAIRNSLIDYDVAQMYEKGSSDRSESWKSAIVTIEKQAEPIFRELEIEFRKLISGEE